MILVTTKKAFTLVELLVSTSVGALILVLLLQVSSQSMQIWKRSTDTLINYNSGTAAMDLLIGDLDSLAVTRQPAEYLNARPESISGGGISVNATDLMLNSISTQDTINSSSDQGQVRAVRYRIAYQDPTISGGSVNVFGLYRSVVSATDTFTKVLGNKDVYDAYWKGQTGPPLDDFFIPNVVDFQISFYVQGGATAANVGNPVTSTRLSGLGAMVDKLSGTYVTGELYTAGQISWAEVNLTILNDAGAKLLGTVNLTNPTLKDEFFKKYGHVLTRKVVLRTP